MWISRKEYKFLKENAEKNIDAECAILKAKDIQTRAAARALEEYSNVLRERDELKLRTIELENKNDYYKGARDFIEWLLTNDKYSACTIDTDEEYILCEVGLIEDMWTESADELFKEFKKSR